MPDLNDQLRRYIDGLEDPVTVPETMARRRSRRYRVPVAVLAGAAVVLIPTLVLLGIRFATSDGDIAEPTSVPPVVTSTTTTTTTGAPTASPARDLIGLTIPEVVELAATGFDWHLIRYEVDPDRAGLVIGQSPLPGEPIDEGGSIGLVVGQSAECLSGPPPAESPGTGEMTITVLFECANLDAYPGDWIPLTRIVPSTDDAIGATLTSLLRGPTAAELSVGFGSFFTNDSGGALNTVELSGGGLTVDFNDAILIGNTNTGSGSQFFLAELQVNLFQFPGVESIELRRNGTCDAFWGGLERDCRILTRSDWNAQLQEWDNAREDEEPAAAGVVVPGGENPGVLIATAEGVDYGANGTLHRFLQAGGESEDPQRPAIASDRAGGFFLAQQGRIYWHRGDGSPAEMLPVPDGLNPENSRHMAVISSGDTPLLLHFGFTEEDYYGFELEPLEPWRDGISQALHDGFIAGWNDRFVALVDESGEVVTQEHFNEPVAITYLSAGEGENGEPQLVKVSGIHSSVVAIHDFDGRRVIVSTHPGEPALANTSYFVIDLECAACLEAFVTGPGEAALTGIRTSEGPIDLGTADLGRCSLTLGGRPPIDSSVSGVAGEWHDILQSDAEACRTRQLHAQAARDETMLQFSHAHAGDLLAAQALGVEVVRHLYYALRSEPGSYIDENGDEVFVWPALASPDIDWNSITSAEAAELQDRYSETIEWLNTIEPDVDLIEESIALETYAGWWVEIDETGRWRFFGRWIS